MSSNAQSFMPNMSKGGKDTQGMTFAVTKDSEVTTVNGTGHEDIISVRRNESKLNVNAGAGDDQVTIYGYDEITPKEFTNYHEVVDELKNKPWSTTKGIFDSQTNVQLGEGADTVSIISELDGRPNIMAKHTGANGKVNGRGVAGENDKALDHWAGTFGFVDVKDFNAGEDKLEILGHTTTLGESFTKNGHFFQTVYSEQNADDQSGPRAGAAHDDTLLGVIRFQGGAKNAKGISKAINVSAMEHYVVDGKGKEVFEDDVTLNQTGEDPIKTKPEGITKTITRDSESTRVLGTNNDDIITVRGRAGKINVNAKGGDDQVIVYGYDEITTSEFTNYHEVVEDLKSKPWSTTKGIFDSHTNVKLGKGKDTVSIISELDGRQNIMAKHTQEDGRINGNGVAGENDQALDHWAGSFGFVNVKDFNAGQDKLKILGHTTTLGESFTKNGHFFQTVYSEQNANDQSGPRAGAAHDDTLLGVIRFEGGAKKANAISKAINVSAMEHYVVDGRGQQVVDADPTINQTGGKISPGPLMTFALADAETNTLVKGFENLNDGAKVNMNGLDLNKYTVIAQINYAHPDAKNIESVKFESNLGNRVENKANYTLFGDNNNNYAGRMLKTGDFSIKATAYTQDGAQGEEVSALDIDFSVVNGGKDDMLITSGQGGNSMAKPEAAQALMADAEFSLGSNTFTDAAATEDPFGDALAVDTGSVLTDDTNVSAI
ncbi:MAG: hypothetical protein AAFQ57_05790 [Cyanobacteria bacterium J06626_14]